MTSADRGTNSHGTHRSAAEHRIGPEDRRTHQSTVATILRAVELGLFTAAQAELMIDRVRAHLTAPPITAPVASLWSAADGFPATVSGLASDTLPAPPAAIVLTVRGGVDALTSTQLVRT